MSKQTFRSAVEAALETPITDVEARMEFAQCISDCAVGCDITPVLSERLTPQYIYDHMGGLEGPEEGDLERLQGVEAYNIIFGDDSAEFVVDRRSIFDKNEEKKSYCSDKDAQLINAALQRWFKANVFMKKRVEGTDPSVVDRLVESKINLPFGIGACLKYGILHSCFEFPESLHNTNQEEKSMFIEMFASLVNVRAQIGTKSEYPYVHVWEHEELRFRLRAITYSDQRYLTVHMPGYL